MAWSESLLKFVPLLPEIAKFCTKYFILSKVYTDEVDMNISYFMVCLPVQEIINSLKSLFPLTGG